MSSLRLRILLSFLAGVFLLEAGLGIWHFRHMRWLVESQFEQAIRTFARQIAQQAIPLIFAEDVGQLQTLASHSAGIPSLCFVDFRNQDGTMILSTRIPGAPPGRRENWEAKRRPPVSKTRMHRIGQSLRIHEPVFLTSFAPEETEDSSTRLIGEIGLEFSRSEVEGQLRETKRLIVFSGVGAALVALLVMVLLERWVTRPLAHLIEKVREIAKGNLSIRVEVPETTGEIAVLCESVNQMADALEEHTGNLERRVHERTLQLESANRELEAFAYSVSHDLRAPLRGIDGWSLALVEDCRDCLDEQGIGYLNRVRSETQRMGQLIDDLLNLSRVNRSPFVRKDVDLTAVAETVVARLQEQFPERRIEFRIQDGLSAHADAAMMEILLTNLLENAVKFTRDRDEALIEFREEPAEEGMAFLIRDNGVGFDMAYAGKLFGAFQRLHKTAEFAGSGIGLATVARIVNRHGGRIWAFAEVDRGASFYFQLGKET